MDKREKRKVDDSGMGRKNGLVECGEGLEGRFSGKNDLDIVLEMDLGEFFDFCHELTLDGYRADGYAGKLQSPEDFVRHRVGNCWDQTELQRAWFERHGYKVKTYLLYYYLNDDCCPSHSVLMYEDEGRMKWFEPMFCGVEVEYSGVHEYKGEDEALADVRRVFAENGQKMEMLPERLEDEKWALYEYTKPKYGIEDVEFYDHCRRGKRIL